MTIPKRSLVTISLQNYDSRKDELITQLITAAEESGFFAPTDHGITEQEISDMFATSHQFFSLPEEVKTKYYFERMKNAGWECNSQLRPSTGTYDMKESLQLQYASQDSITKYPSDNDCPGFETMTKTFMEKCNGVSHRVMRLFAISLGMEEDWFSKCQDISREDCMSTLRMLHYHDLGTRFPEGHWRAGAHTDFDILTLLFQKPGQSGLEICPGRSVSTSFAHGDIWTPIDFPTATTIVCNIGDMLMHLSSDRFKSTFHRVRAPKMEGDKGEGARMSLAWFNQPCKGTKIVDRMGKYEELSAEEFILRGMRRNYEVNMHRGMEVQTQSEGDSTLNEGSDGHTTKNTISTADLTVV